MADEQGLTQGALQFANTPACCAKCQMRGACGDGQAACLCTEYSQTDRHEVESGKLMKAGLFDHYVYMQFAVAVTGETGYRTF